MDANTLNLIGRAAHGIPADAAATLLAELDSNEGEGIDLREQAECMTEICRRYRSVRSRDRLRPGPTCPIMEGAEGALSHPLPIRPREKPINFVDDVVVPAERISELIRIWQPSLPGSVCRLRFSAISETAMPTSFPCST